MNLLSKQYKMYRLQLRIQSALFSIILLCGLYVGYLGFSYWSDTNALKNYHNLNGKISETQNKIAKIDANMVELNERLTELDVLLNAEPLSEDELKSFSPNNILYNVLHSVNDGTKLYNIIVVGKQIEITGVSNDIDEVSSVVCKLSDYYNVEINKTQQISHTNEELYYAFKIILNSKGGSIN